MNKRVVFSIVLMAHSFMCVSQYVVKSPEELVSLKQLPQEKAYIDHTGPVLFAGEYLYYAMYCFNAQNNRLTAISKVGYVALVNEDKEYVFEHKVKLNKGLGQGDFFVTTDIPSGNYKLLGYTQWMKNNGLSQVYKDNITIINPYLADQSKLLTNADPAKNKSAQVPTVPNRALDSATVSIFTDKKHYTPRENVTLTIKNYKGPLGNGAYTVKVKKKEELTESSSLDAVSFATDYFRVDKQIQQKVGDSLFLPEQRGELLFGSVKDSVTGETVQDVPVIISVPGKEFLLKFSQTDADGIFYSYLRKDYKNPIAIVQIEDEDNSYIITQGAPAQLALEDLTFSKFTMTKAQEETIKKRSIRNQIENQFYESKPDSILQGFPIDPFEGGIPEEVVLDEYTRFPTFEETMVEVVKFSGYRNGGKGNDYVRVGQDFETYNEEMNSLPSIVLIDGVFIPNHEKIKNFDARRIEKIRLIRDQFRLGGKDYQGIVSVETFKGDYLEGYAYDNSVVVDLKKPIPVKNYYTQRYSSEQETFSRIPDYRYLLFWKPQLLIDSSSYEFQFFTSDETGDYEVILNGFTTYGKPISLKKEFSVKKLD